MDIRWRKRKGAKIAAEAALSICNDIKSVNPEALSRAAEYIAINASEIGFFGIWFDIFKQEPLVIKKLIDSRILPGTATECFDDETFELKYRNPTNRADQI